MKRKFHIYSVDKARKVWEDSSMKVLFKGRHMGKTYSACMRAKAVGGYILCLNKARAEQLHKMYDVNVCWKERNEWKQLKSLKN